MFIKSSLLSVKYKYSHIFNIFSFSKILLFSSIAFIKSCFILISHTVLSISLFIWFCLVVGISIRFERLYYVFTSLCNTFNLLINLVLSSIWSSNQLILFFIFQSILSIFWILIVNINSFLISSKLFHDNILKINSWCK